MAELRGEKERQRYYHRPLGTARRIELPATVTVIPGYPHLHLSEVTHGVRYGNCPAYPGDKSNDTKRSGGQLRPYVTLGFTNPARGTSDADIAQNFYSHDFTIDAHGEAIYYGSNRYTQPIWDHRYRSKANMTTHYANLHRNSLAIAGIIGSVLGDAYMIDNRADLATAAELDARWAAVSSIHEVAATTERSESFWLGIDLRLPVWNQPLTPIE